VPGASPGESYLVSRNVPTMKPTRGLWICCIGLLLAGLAGGAPVPKEGVLRYRFKEGETLHCTIVEKGAVEFGAAGTKIESTSTFDSTWKVTKVEKGKAAITWTIDRIQMKGDTPVGAMSYDSKSDKEPDNEIGKMLAKALGAYAGGELKLLLDERGRIESVKYSDKLAAAIAGVPAELAPITRALAEDGLRRMVGQCLPVLPEQPPVKGKPWESQLKVRLDNIDFTLNSKYTAEGESAHGGVKLEKIVNKPTIAMSVAPGSEEKLTLNKQEASATAWFNRATGRLVEAEYTQKVELDMTANGETTTIKGAVTTTLKLTGKPK
jgi:hypothetical protein